MKDRSPTSPGRDPAKNGAADGGGGSSGHDLTRVPGTPRMPDGYEVVEQGAGRAVGQWVLQVRCECGRRWFEVEAIEAANCPRCGLLVRVDVQARSTG